MSIAAPELCQVFDAFTLSKVCESVGSPVCPNKHVPTLHIVSQNHSRQPTVRSGLSRKFPIGRSRSGFRDICRIDVHIHARGQLIGDVQTQTIRAMHPIFGSFEGRTVSSVLLRIVVYLSPANLLRVLNLEFQIMTHTGNRACGILRWRL